MNKSKIRSEILKFRKKKFNKKLKINLDKFISFLKINIHNAKNIGGYYPSNYEIDDLEILDVLDKQNFKISLPIVKKNNQMNFYSWSKKDPLTINKFGIPEPVSLKILYPDIILVPLVSYDNNLNRLGYGGGFYDRYLERYLKTHNSILTIGVAFSFQKHHKLPVSNTDIKLDYILTEKGFV